MLRYRAYGWLTLALLLVPAPACSEGSRSPVASSAAPRADSRAAAAEAYAKLPLHFEPIDGGFVSQADGFSLLLGPDSATLSVPGNGQGPVRLRFAGANPEPVLEAVDRLPGTSNYAVGAPAAWRTGVPHFARVRYQALYPGIDLVFYGNQRELEYDFLVAPGADPSAIRVSMEASAPPRLDEGGNLVLVTPGGELVQRAPRLYQEMDGGRRPVAGRYVLLDPETVTFEIGAYDTGLALVIDPVITYSTYLGGTADDWSMGIAVDSAGNAYLAGGTSSSNFPGHRVGPASGPGEALVTKLSPSGALVYSTVLGGSSFESAAGVAVDGSGNAYVTGHTRSDDFPLRNPFQGSRRGGADAFVTKLDPSGAVAYSTYLGGSDDESGEGGIGVDGAGQAYVSAYTFSTDFPTRNPFQAANAGGFGDVFVTKLDASGSNLVYSTYLGGSAPDRGYDIAVTAEGIATATGSTESANFPTRNAQQPALRGYGDAFVASFDPAGGLRYSTFLGGSINDIAQGVATDAAASAYVTGVTTSPDYPLMNPAQAVHAGGVDAFATKLHASGALVYSTYLGGSGHDVGQEIAVDGSGHAYVSGVTTSSDFPIEDPVRSTKTAANEAFLTKLTPAGNDLVYSSYLGPSREGDEHTATAVAVDAAGNASVVGTTGADDFPTVNAFQPTRRGLLDVFALRLTAGTTAGTVVSPSFGETGSAITAQAGGGEPGATYVLKISTTAANCGTGIPVGAGVTADAGGNIGPVTRFIPNNVTSGTRYLCFVSAEDSSVVIAPTAITVF